MENNLTQGLAVDSRQMQDMLTQAMSEAIKSMPKPQIPSWLDAIIEFLKAHPWTSLLIVTAVILIISAIIRELICSYLKINEISARLKRLEERLK